MPSANQNIVITGLDTPGFDRPGFFDEAEEPLLNPMTSPPPRRALVSMADELLEGLPAGPTLTDAGRGPQNVLFMQKKVLFDPMVSPQVSPEVNTRRPYGQKKEEAPGAKMPQASLFTSWCVLTNTLLGVGLLGLPWSISTLGLALGFGLLACSCFLAAMALHFLSKIAIRSLKGSQGPAEVSFYAVCVSVAPESRFIVDIALAFKCFGVATSYLQVVGQSGTSLVAGALRSYYGTSPAEDDLRLWVILGVLLVVITPSAFHKSIGKSPRKNMIAICAWVYIVAVVVYYSLRPETEKVDSDWQVGPPSSLNMVVVASTMPVLIFSFTCHQNLFPIVNEMKQRTVRRLDIIIVGAVGTTAALYCTVATMAYKRFGTKLDANFISNLPHEPPVVVAEVLVCIAVVLTYPLQLHPCRRSLMIMLQSFLHRFLDRREERLLRRAFTVGILVGTTLVAMRVKDLGIVLAFVGALGSTTVVLIMPAFLYMKVFKDQRNWEWYIAATSFCIGCVVLPVSLVAVTMKALSGVAMSER